MYTFIMHNHIRVCVWARARACMSEVVFNVINMLLLTVTSQPHAQSTSF
jgi:hypothetical protein